MSDGDDAPGDEEDRGLATEDNKVLGKSAEIKELKSKVSQKKGRLLISHLRCIFALVFLASVFSEFRIKQIKLHAGTSGLFDIHRTRQIFPS